jgi:hypothetical protein
VLCCQYTLKHRSTKVRPYTKKTTVFTKQTKHLRRLCSQAEREKHYEVLDRLDAVESVAAAHIALSEIKNYAQNEYDAS